MDHLLQLLERELGHLPQGDGLLELLDASELKKFSTNDIIIKSGRVVRDVFIVNTGIVRFADVTDDKDRTFGFALPGSIFSSKYSFVMNRPSYYQVTACCDTSVIQIPYNIFWAHVKRYPALAIWLLEYAYGEMFFQEYKNSQVFNGTAKERFIRQLGDRPEIINSVPQKYIASYLGITPEYYCQIKRDYLLGRLPGIKKS